MNVNLAGNRRKRRSPGEQMEQHAEPGEVRWAAHQKGTEPYLEKVGLH
jgi:hypothetical protein